MAPTTRSAAESDWNEGQTAEMHALQQQMATLMHQVEQLKAGNHQRDEEIDRLRRQSATRGQSEAGQRAETPARSDASVAPATVGSSSASGISKPMCHGLRPLNGLSRAIKPSSSFPFFLVLISSSSVFPFFCSFAYITVARWAITVLYKILFPVVSVFLSFFSSLRDSLCIYDTN